MKALDYFELTLAILLTALAYTTLPESMFMTVGDIGVIVVSTVIGAVTSNAVVWAVQ